MTNETKARTDKRQTEPDVIDPNPWDISPRSETEAHTQAEIQAWCQAQQAAAASMPSITWGQLGFSRNARPVLIAKAPPFQGIDCGVFVFAVEGEEVLPSIMGFRAYKPSSVEGGLFIVSASSERDARAWAQLGIDEACESARRYHFADASGKAQDLIDEQNNAGFSVDHYGRKAH